jgi:uncharacterized protein (UPF0332 family)
MTSDFNITSTLERAFEKIKTAKILFEHQLYDDATSRAYYAVFHAISAVLLLKGMVFSSHGQTIGAFNKEFIKSGIFPSNFSKILYELFEDRHTGDYNVIFHIEEEKAQSNIYNAEKIINSIKEYLNSQGVL